jgi:hypothetical protein
MGVQGGGCWVRLDGLERHLMVAGLTGGAAPKGH